MKNDGDHCLVTSKDKQRFWAKVAIVDTGMCWNWVGSKDRAGYGLFRLDGKSRRAHRVSYMLKSGTLPPSEMHVMHACDNPSCVNPSHLTAGSPMDNAHDMFRKGRGVVPNNVGANNPMSKFSDFDIFFIRAWRRSGHKLADIAGAFHTDQSTISKICRRETWRHL